MNGKEEIRFKAATSDLIVALYAVLAIFLTPWKVDDGWVYLTLEHFREAGAYRYVILMDDAEYTFVKIWFAALRLFSVIDHRWWFLRIPSALLAIATWVTVRHILQRLNATRAIAVIVALTVYLLGMSTFLITLRPEPLYVFVVSLVLYCVLRWFEEGNVGWFIGAISAAALGPAVHPVGLAAPLLCIVALLLGYRALGRREWLIVIGAGVSAALVALRLILWNLSWRQFLTLLSRVNREETHSRGVFDEYLRYRELHQINPALELIFIVAFLALLLLARLSQQQLRSYMRFLCSGAVVLLLFLTLYPAKWSHYLAMFVPFAAIILGSLVGWQADRVFPTRACLKFGSALCLLLVMTDATKLGFQTIAPGAVSLLRRELFGAHFVLTKVRDVVGTEAVYFWPRYYPYFSEFTMIPLDKGRPMPKFVLGDFAPDFFAEQFDEPARSSVVLRFLYEGTPTHLYQLESVNARRASPTPSE